MKKRIIERSLALLLALLCVGAVAAVAEVTVASFTIDKCVAGNDYLFVVLKKGASAKSFGSDDVLFMDQITATGAKAQVAVVLPDFTECVAVAGGSFSGGVGSPRKLGDYTATHLPEQLSAIDDAAFEGTSFTHLFLGKQVNTIGSRAFANCALLAYVYIPDSVTSIANDAFSGSKNVVIGCRKNSAAHAFAKSSGIAFQLVN